MLKITRIGTNQTLDLPEGQKITLEIVSMLLGSSDVLQGSYSYPFQFPLNENNCRFIDNGHLPESDAPAEIPVIVTEGTFVFRAMMGYEADGDYADAYLLVDFGEIADIIRDKPIREFVKEQFLVSARDDASNPTVTMQQLAEAEPCTYPIVFAPFLAPNFVAENFEPGRVSTSPNIDYARPVVVNPFHYSHGGFYDVANGEYGDKTAAVYNRQVVVHVPMVYLVWLLRRIAESLGFRPTGPALEDPELKRLVIWNTQAIPGSVNKKYTVHIDRHLPFETISSLFSSLRDYLGMGIFFNTSDRTVYFACYKHLRRSTQMVDLSSAYIPTKPKVSRGEWKGYRIQNDTGEGEESLEGMFDYVKSFKIGDRPDAEVQMSISTLAMERIPVAQSYGDTTPSGNWPPEAVRWYLPTTEASGNLSNSFFDKHEGGPNYDAADNYVPYVPELAPDMQHIEELAASEPVSNRWGLRLLMYYGMQQDTAGNLYPQMGSVSYGAKYQTIGTLSLLPGQPDDVFRKYQRYWYECLSFSRKVELPLKLSIPQANQLRPEIPVYLRMEHLASAKYLINRISYELPAEGAYMNAKLEATQLIPSHHSPNWADPDIYGAKWLEIRLENISSVDQVNYTADVVIYVWEDGGRTIPFNSLSVTANVGVLRKKLAETIPTRYTEEKLAAGSFLLTQHRNVVFSQVKYYEGRDLFLGGQYHERQIVLFDQYYLQYGEGYRIIAEYGTATVL